MHQPLDIEEAQRKMRIRFWKETAYWSVGFYILWVVYLSLWQGRLVFGTLVESLGGAASILLAISFALGTFCFYFDVLDRDLGYRKYFGLMSFWFVVAYTILLMLGKPEENLFPPLAGQVTLPQALGLGALLVLTFMAIIGNDGILQRENPKLWRNLLRSGYSVYAFLIARAFILDRDIWEAWLIGQSFSVLPPPSLVMTIMGVCVVLFRLSVFPARWWRRGVSSLLKPPQRIQKSDGPEVTTLTPKS